MWISINHDKQLFVYAGDDRTVGLDTMPRQGGIPIADDGLHGHVQISNLKSTRTRVSKHYWTADSFGFGKNS